MWATGNGFVVVSSIFFLPLYYEQQLMLKQLWRAKKILYFYFNGRICLSNCYPLKVKFTFHDSKFQPLDLQLQFCLNATEDTKQNHLLVLEVAALRDTQCEPGPRGMMRSPSWNTEAELGASYQPRGDQVHSRRSWIGCGASPSAGEQKSKCPDGNPLGSNPQPNN